MTPETYNTNSAIEDAYNRLKEKGLPDWKAIENLSNVFGTFEVNEWLKTKE